MQSFQFWEAGDHLNSVLHPRNGAPLQYVAAFGNSAYGLQFLISVNLRSLITIGKRLSGAYEAALIWIADYLSPYGTDI
ncbi:hypothetical protein D6851_00110 [Altericroceibacterium spongiae]|uniref:Uncharacterized protein n=1 Tax=Altericroceibacterium spongiae TaxID=2320269 RepID=A0A420EQK3_9SPHN|nr:hypothetical protein D6851_00110 [Altericroceibacterium spongiae]